MKCVAMLLAVIASAGLAQGQKSPGSQVAEFPRFTISAGRVSGEYPPLSGVKLCALPKGSACFEMPPKRKENSNEVDYQFAFSPQSKRLKLQSGGSLVFFTGTFSAGGSGTLERLALLRFNKGRMVNLLPLVAVTNQSERKIVWWPEISELPVLVTADFLWDFDKGETHFAPHFYEVQVYRYDQTADRYEKTLSYKTSRKYEGLDSRDVIRVIGFEKAEILRRIQETARP